MMNPDHHIYGSSELAPLLGITQRMLQHWSELRLIRATVYSHRRHFEYPDALACAFIAELRKRHLSLRTVRQVLAKVSRHWKKHGLPNYVVLAGTTVHFATTAEQCVSLAGNSRLPLYIVDMQALRERLRGGR